MTAEPTEQEQRPPRPRVQWQRLVKRGLQLLAAGLAVLLAVVVVRTVTFRSRQVRVAPVAEIEVDARAVAERLGQAVRFPTISHEDPARFDGEAFRGFHGWLIEAYPRTHAALRREVVGGYSLLYTWPGTDPALPPVLLLAHQDVVPAESPQAWSHPPFGGVVADGYVWGRGAIDCKGPIVGIFEAVETLLAEGHRPRRTVYLAFGHDEEVGGRSGAAAMAGLLEGRGVRPEFVLDEGGAITVGVINGIDRPVAAVGIAEKGYLSLELTADAEGGHSSMPPGQTAVGIVSAGVARLEADPFPARLSGVARQTLDYLGPEMPLARRGALANLWLLGPLVERQLLAAPATAATLRTTTAATIFEAGVKDNVLPRRAKAVVNFRILPGETADSVTERVRKVIGDERVRVSRAGEFASDPSPVAGTDSTGFRVIQQTIGQVAPECVVAPVLVVGGTDSRHYARLTPSVFRFIPVRVRPEDLATIHGDNERLPVEDCGLLVRFYVRLLRNAT